MKQFQVIIEAPDEFNAAGIIGNPKAINWVAGATILSVAEVQPQPFEQQWTKVEAGQATGGSEKSLINKNKDWKPKQFQHLSLGVSKANKKSDDYYIRIHSGKGTGQMRLILNNEKHRIIPMATWTIRPDKTSGYNIIQRDHSIM